MEQKRSQDQLFVLFRVFRGYFLSVFIQRVSNGAQKQK